jgi:hypothetical protein
VTLPEIPALIWRHVVAVLLVLVVAAGVAYSIKRTPPTYQESATAVFIAPPSTEFPNPYASFNSSLITTAEVMTRFIMGPQGQQQVRAAGGTAKFAVSLVNLYNQQYPNYSQPYAQISATSTNPAAVHNTFLVVTRLLVHNLAESQAQQNVPAHTRVSIHPAADAGPLVQPGSSKRTFAGLLVLTIVAVLFVAAFLDKHPVRLVPFKSLLRPTAQGLPGRSRPAGAAAFERKLTLFILALSG